MSPSFLPRDFIETEEGLVFAVVSSGEEEGRVLGCLRYQRSTSGYAKLSTQAANILLRSTWPGYLFYSNIRDAHLHAVPLERIVRHSQPRRRVQELMALGFQDAIERKLVRLLELFAKNGVTSDCIGVTGSLLIGAQQRHSDIDLVIYGREPFFQARRIVERLIGRRDLDPLGKALWRDAYARRGCQLSFEEYLWHERRKFNKAAIEKTKFDLSLVDAPPDTDAGCYRKRGRTCLQARVVSDDHAFDHPSRYQLDHPSVAEVLSFTATYAGQAQVGEVIEVCGQLEASRQDVRRIVVGSDREAAGQYIKVVRTAEH